MRYKHLKTSQVPISIKNLFCLVALNGNRGLLDLSEENLEKMHKVVRQLREKGARLLSMLANPVVRTVKPPVTCKHCHQVGHSTRGCKVLAAERNPQELSEDDVAFWSYVKPDQRPATVAGAAQDNYSDEESEDNDSDEEGDIDEDMMDID